MQLFSFTATQAVVLNNTRLSTFTVAADNAAAAALRLASALASVSPAATAVNEFNRMGLDIGFTRTQAAFLSNVRLLSREASNIINNISTEGDESGSGTDPVINTIRDTLDTIRHEYSVLFSDLDTVTVEGLSEQADIWQEQLSQAAEGGTDRAIEALSDALREIEQLVETGTIRITKNLQTIAERAAEVETRQAQDIYNALVKAQDAHENNIAKALDRLEQAFRGERDALRKRDRAQVLYDRAVEESDLKRRKSIVEAQNRLNNLRLQELRAGNKIANVIANETRRLN